MNFICYHLLSEQHFNQVFLNYIKKISFHSSAEGTGGKVYILYYPLFGTSTLALVFMSPQPIRMLIIMEYYSVLKMKEKILPLMMKEIHPEDTIYVK